LDGDAGRLSIQLSDAVDWKFLCHGRPQICRVGKRGIAMMARRLFRLAHALLAEPIAWAKADPKLGGSIDASGPPLPTLHVPRRLQATDPMFIGHDNGRYDPVR
jgi:hypothetical protein